MKSLPKVNESCRKMPKVAELRSKAFNNLFLSDFLLKFAKQSHVISCTYGIVVAF